MSKERVNRRAISRYPVMITVRFRWLDGWCEGTTRDLSARGCTIAAAFVSKPPLARGNFLIIQLQLPSETEPMLVNPAVVRWVQGTRFGVEFIGNRPIDEQRMSEFLEKFKVSEMVS